MCWPCGGEGSPGNLDGVEYLPGTLVEAKGNPFGSDTGISKSCTQRRVALRSVA